MSNAETRLGVPSKLDKISPPESIIGIHTKDLDPYDLQRVIIAAARAADRSLYWNSVFIEREDGEKEDYITYGDDHHMLENEVEKIKQGESVTIPFSMRIARTRNPHKFEIGYIQVLQDERPEAREDNHGIAIFKLSLPNEATNFQGERERLENAQNRFQHEMNEILENMKYPNIDTVELEIDEPIISIAPDIKTGPNKPIFGDKIDIARYIEKDISTDPEVISHIICDNCEYLDTADKFPNPNDFEPEEQERYMEILRKHGIVERPADNAGACCPECGNVSEFDFHPFGVDNPTDSVPPTSTDDTPIFGSKKDIGIHIRGGKNRMKFEN